ncbi:hypothetical protein [Photobacterium galatheae]|uniref:Uncharacterized protein n=1 Tax=Photobacterium galatheae TaxID=1654360 RepID=A0A066RTE8_9GAMM|nr:hypothetical protein [Photobacterium galatheae]KDM90982.1 hypothetical protein EA58_14620 [Photobacterium galatheae]MCM0149061.1 hypothetical protein [Photobacterium galatheae]
MKSVDVFEDVRALRRKGGVFSILGAVMVGGVIFASEYFYQSQEIVRNVMFFVGLASIMTFLSVYSLYLGKISIREDLESAYKNSAAMYFLTALAHSVSEFFIFFLGEKQLSGIPNWIALGLYGVISLFTLVQILKATKN